MFLRALAVGVLLLGGSAWATTPNAKPNIVIIFTDD